MSNDRRGGRTILDDLEPGKEIGPEDNRFVLVERIGLGGMGQVWQARDLNEERLEGGERFKALKVIASALQDSTRALTALEKEAVRASRLSHPNIINVYYSRRGPDGWLFVVMDYLEGRDLGTLLDDEGPAGLPWARVVELLQPIAEGLDYAHANGVIHRDLKPENVFVTNKGEIKLLDFGLAYQMRRTGSMMYAELVDSSGTPHYMSPEAHLGALPSKAQDIYGLAVMTFELLVGNLPFSEDLLHKRTKDMVPHAPAALQAAAWQVLRRGLAYEPEARPESAQALIEGMAAGQRRPVAKPQPKLDAVPKAGPVAAKASGGGWKGVLVVGMVVGVVVWFFSMQREPPEPSEPMASTEPPLSVVAPPAEVETPAIAIPEPKPTLTVEPTQPTHTEVFRDTLSNGDAGPEMVYLEGGTYWMGSPEGEEGRDDDEKRHQVTVEPFAIGKYEVTFAEYDRFAEATKRERPDDAGWGRGNRPVINVSWEDATAYAAWLSEETGQGYRLPTEAEWEYAARAGTETPFAFGGTIRTDQANFGFEVGKTVSVGQYSDNAWGLHDMHGNVWEWTCTKYVENYNGIESEECISKNNANKADSRVVRGGSWYHDPSWVRSADRVGNAPDWRYNGQGFRLARSF